MSVHDDFHSQAVPTAAAGFRSARPEPLGRCSIRAGGSNAGAPESRARRLGAFALAVGIQAIFIAVWVWTQPVLVPARPQPLMMVSILPQETPRTPEQTLPQPRLEAPQVTMTIPVLPEIAVDLPPPAAPTNAITAEMTAAPQSPSARQREPYENLILRVINSHLRYPPLARARQQQGTATVRFAIDRRGNLLSYAVERSSRFAALDHESLALLRRAQPLPAPPAEIAGERIELVVPITFLLR